MSELELLFSSAPPASSAAAEKLKKAAPKQEKIHLVWLSSGYSLNSYRVPEYVLGRCVVVEYFMSILGVG